ncbi:MULTISPECIES: anti-repressor SinI family protein [Bacillus]|nr:MULTISPECIES: anti-repressor SinI family protein [Bacillus]MED1095102.1 anti-repressor SinI family protein [Bacillus capparidis]
MDQLDEEWKELILEALAARITLEEIRIFLNTCRERQKIINA